MATRSPFFTPSAFQNVGELLHFAMQLLVGEDANFSGFALPDDCGFVLAPGVDVAVEAVVGEIDLAADKPFRPRAIPLENLVPFLEPVQFARQCCDQNLSGSSTDSL